MALRRGKETHKPCIAAINALKKEAQSMHTAASNDTETGKAVSSSQAQGNKDINFGWFTLPGAVPDSELETRADQGDHGLQQAPASRASGYPQDIRPNLQSRSANRPPSHTGAPPGQTNGGPNYPCPPPKTSLRPSTQQGQQLHFGAASQGDGSDRLVVDHSVCDIGQGEGLCPAVDAMQSCDDDHLIIDWPISSIAQEYTRTQRQAVAQNKARPGTQGCKVPVPTTPLPPLTFGGYSKSARPTYETWRDQWHKTVNGLKYTQKFQTSALDRHSQQSDGNTSSCQLEMSL
ncbi:hypothetical protein Bpfe_029873 [Biomphalaria pfeifferi]|uniref:Uncharacterized protein n=1 Tax=Biomphalaria pfeifferi TaxID=112525 RepID=A0AAD8EVH1_BIOPF|nr:hypothetical protein Bpfe_029873 [Biomphalaria pfeifferi]